MKFWDDYKIKDKIMIGYWEKTCPVTCSNPMTKASIYKSADEVIIAVANWTEQDQEVAMAIDWAKLGMDKTKYEVFIPEIKDFQQEQKKVSLDKLTIPGKKGYLLLSKQKNK